jgi:phosphoenolpyruvate carboxylase
MRQSGFESFRRSIASDASRRDDLVRLNAIPWILWDDGWMMLLPGPYGVCNAVRGGSVRTSG